MSSIVARDLCIGDLSMAAMEAATWLTAEEVEYMSSVLDINDERDVADLKRRPRDTAGPLWTRYCYTIHRWSPAEGISMICCFLAALCSPTSEKALDCVRSLKFINARGMLEWHTMPRPPESWTIVCKILRIIRLLSNDSIRLLAAYEYVNRDDPNVRTETFRALVRGRTGYIGLPVPLVVAAMAVRSDNQYAKGEGDAIRHWFDSHKDRSMPPGRTCRFCAYWLSDQECSIEYCGSFCLYTDARLSQLSASSCSTPPVAATAPAAGAVAVATSSSAPTVSPLPRLDVAKAVPIDGDNDPEECSLCTEYKKNVAAVPCGHRLCVHCFNKYYATKVAPLCCVCSGTVTTHLLLF